MEVKLLTYTRDPEFFIASAARLSIGGEIVSREGVERLLKKLISMGHMSPFEHASFTFLIRGISRVASHQLVRHRIASYTQESQRFVELEPSFVIPESINGEMRERVEKILLEASSLYKEMVEKGIPLEDARFILPQAVKTNIIVTMNARELIYASSLRLCSRAQWEIREVFRRMKEEVMKVAPIIGEEMKPKCYTLGYCNERESCGLFPLKSKV